MAIKQIQLSPFIALLALFCGGLNFHKLPFVKDRKSPELLAGSRGVIITNQKRGLNAISLPSKKKKVIISPGSVHRISGPDKKGNIAYIATTYETFSLKTIGMKSGKQKTFFTRTGSYWPHEKQNFGNSMALSPVGSLVAFISNYHGVQFKKPYLYVAEGDLEIWNIKTGKQIKIIKNVLDQGISWFPKGRRLALVRAVSREKVSEKMREHEDDKRKNKTWLKVPVIKVHDVYSDTEQTIFPGLNPLISPNGKKILINEENESYIMYNLSSARVTSVSFPGQSFRAFAFINNDTLLYQGNPAEGEAQKSRRKSMGGRIPIWLLKIGKINSNKYYTVSQELDIHNKVSFGIPD